MLDKDKENASIWYLLGLEYSEQGGTGEALYAFSHALKFCDDDLKEKIIIELTNISSKEVNKDKQSDGSWNTVDESIEDNNSSAEDSGLEEKGNLIKLKLVKGKLEKDIKADDAENTSITFEDVGGLEELKDTIRMKIIKPFINPGLFSRFKKKVGGGILLYGPPGCGKTFIAKATAGECNAKFIPVHISDILDPYLGVSEQNIKSIFESARANKPCILFFDEIDAIGYNRAKSSSQLMRPIIDQLLSEIEGIDTDTDKLLIIGATNMPWDVDIAFKRPGRFDRMIFVAPPDLSARETIFRLKLKDRPTEDIDYSLLAQKTEFYSGADIENVVDMATEYVIDEIMKSEIERPIRNDDLLKAISCTKPSTVEWLKTISNYVKYANQSGLYNDVEKYISKHKKQI